MGSIRMGVKLTRNKSKLSMNNRPKNCFPPKGFPPVQLLPWLAWPALAPSFSYITPRVSRALKSRIELHLHCRSGRHSFHNYSHAPGGKKKEKNGIVPGASVPSPKAGRITY